MDDLISDNGQVTCFGPKTVVGRGRFAAAAATSFTLLERMGILSVVQSSTTSGLFTVTLINKHPEFFPLVRAVAATHTDFHDCPVFNVNTAAGTFQFAHYSGARGTTEAVNNGLATSTVFHILVLGRGAM